MLAAMSAHADEHAVGDAAGHAQRARTAGGDPDRHRPVVGQPRRARRADLHASPSSSARMSRVLASSSWTRAGLSPASRTAVSPTPIASSVRPGASSSMVAMDEAVTVGWRVMGLASSGPRMMRSVTRAAAAKSTYVSRRLSCESGWSAASHPSVSARRTSAANASTDGASNRFNPKRGIFTSLQADALREPLHPLEALALAFAAEVEDRAR